MRTSSHLQLRPGQDKAKQFDTYNDTELHGVKQTYSQQYSINKSIYDVSKLGMIREVKAKRPWWQSKYNAFQCIDRH